MRSHKKFGLIGLTVQTFIVYKNAQKLQTNTQTKYKYIDCITNYLNKTHCNQLFELGLGKVKFRFFLIKFALNQKKMTCLKFFFGASRHECFNRPLTGVPFTISLIVYSNLAIQLSSYLTIQLSNYLTIQLSNYLPI